MQDELLRLQSMLRKTIVFITHDFDEAIRLARRIAIMRDGEIVQLGCAEELVLNPADDYVAWFTAKVSFADVIRVGTIMRPVQGEANEAPVSASDLIRDVATRILDADRPLPVAGGDGQIVGSVEPSAVVDVLARRLPGARR
jgi:glycine betaine/proline transport system ATP-binding protein